MQDSQEQMHRLAMQLSDLCSWHQQLYHNDLFAYITMAQIPIVSDVKDGHTHKKCPYTQSLTQAV